MPDLVAHRLSGGAHRSVEMTNGSTTQMMTPGGGAWNIDFLDRIGLPSHFLGPTVKSSSRIGLRNGTPIYAPGTHDTASAVAAVPVAGDKSWAFLSSGTWSLLGCELQSPILSHDAMRAGFSNEAGVDGTTRFLKNIMGLWLVQECRRGMGGEYSYAKLTQLAADASPGSLIDATDNRFLNPANMVEEIRRACVESGQPAPTGPGEIVRCCLESLALAYRRSIRQLESLLARKIEVLHIIGGGSNNAVLNRWTADACGIPVVAGPGEATALGNILAQMIGAGLLSNWHDARAISRASSYVYEFVPNNELHAGWVKREENIVDRWNN
jgi:rhamnulokinase